MDYRPSIDKHKLVINELDLKSNEYIIAFQSKFGTQKWLSPNTLDVLASIAKSGINSVDIICPGFVVDCLETLEEIAIVNKQVFMDNGGIKYNYIPCLNAGDGLTQTLKALVNNYLDED